MFEKKYKISAALPKELATEVYLDFGGEDADKSLAESRNTEPSRSWLVRVEELQETVEKLLEAGFSDLAFAESIIHLIAVGPREAIANVVQDVPTPLSGTLVLLDDLVSSDREVLDFKGAPQDADLIYQILMRHNVTQVLAMEAFVPLEGKPRV
jgi:hypothetical protein